MRYDLHTHYYPASYFELIRRTPGEFSFGTDPTGRTIIRYQGARFFGVTAPMTDPAQRLADMDRVGIDVEVISLSTPNVFFTEGAGPHMLGSIDRAVSSIEGLDIPAHEKQAIFSGTALGILNNV